MPCIHAGRGDQCLEARRVEATGTHPPHDLKVWELLETKRYDEAKELFDSVNDPIRHFYDRTSERSGGQARVKKGLMEIVGRPVGASRPPSKPLNAEEMKELRGIVEGFGWPTA